MLISQQWRTGSYYVDVGYGGFTQTFVESNWGNTTISYRPGSVSVQQTGTSITCGHPYPYRTVYTASHTRMIFGASDGTQYELRDLVNDGRIVARPSGSCSTNYRVPRGSVWRTTDNSGITFVADAPIYDTFSEDDASLWNLNGWLYFKDGTRYRVVNSSVVKTIDRNGNTTSYSSSWDNSNVYGVVVDALGRQTDLTFPFDGSVTYDKLDYKGFGATPRTIRVHRAPLDQILRADLQPRRAMTYPELFPNLGSWDTGPYNPTLFSSIELPDGNHYRFYYNHYGELARVEMPTGGAVEYDHTPGSGVVGDPTGYSGAQGIYRQLVERRIYPNGGTGAAFESKTTYTYSSSGQGDNYGTTTVVVDTFDNGGARVARRKHYYWGTPLTPPPYGSPYSRWLEGKEFKTETYDPSGDASYVLRRVEMSWRQRAPVSWWWGNAFSEPANDPRVTDTVTTIEPTGSNLVTKRTAVNPNDPNHVGFDQYNNGTDMWEYDYGVGAPGPFLRRVHTDYVTDYAYVNTDANPAAGAGLRSLPREEWTSTDIAGANKAALTVYSYDQYGLADCPSIVGHEPAYTTALTTRGNPTGVTRYADANARTGGVTTSAAYDIAGNVVSTTDARGKTSTINYGDNFSDGVARNTYAFPTSAVSAAPDPSGQFASPASFATWSAYDFATGQVTAATDANGKTTTYQYNDPLDRIKLLTRPDGGSTSYNYDRATNAGVMNDYVHTSSTLDATRSVDSYQFSDGLGRPTRMFLHEGGSPAVFLTTDTQYDALGRVRRVSNPYRSHGAHEAVNPSGRWTTTVYDSLGRTTSVTQADGATTTTSHVGNHATTTDPAGKKRRIVTDALGRVVRADEPDAASGALDDGAGAPVQPTFYTHDILGNLRRVDQGGQLRFFMYDSLSRLVRVKHPEQGANPSIAVSDPVTLNTQWSTSYAYDANGNVVSRTDARGVTTEYGYDALNRNTTVRHFDSVLGAANHTKDIDRHYDGAVNGKGRFWYYNWDQNNNNARFDTHLAVDEYDAVGRPKKYRQHFLTNGAPSPQFLVTRSYDKAGNVVSQTYPSGRVVTYSYDAAGRVNGLSGNLGDGVQRTYTADVTYSEFGRVGHERFGTLTPLYHKRRFNPRGQLFSVRLSTGADAESWNRGMLVNHYGSGDFNTAWGTGGPNNNGNVLRGHHYVPNSDQPDPYNPATFTVFYQDYEYDALNRLTKVTESNSIAWQTQFVQKYGYDRWGNRTIDFGQTWNVPVAQYDFERAELQYTNRLHAPGDLAYPDPNDTRRRMRYDPAGNVVFDSYSAGGGGARNYDAENRITSAVDRNGVWAYYTYDADGRRVKRKIANEEWWQVYGVDGELLAEYPAGGAPFLASKEYGYRGGELLVTMSSGDTDRLRRFVKNLYYNSLARDPSPSELTTGMNQLGQAGADGGETQLLATARAIARSLFESGEYVARYRTTEQYVTDLYNAYLQRGPDAGGLNHWVNNTNQLGRGATLNAFEVSIEFGALAATVYGRAAGGEDQRVDTFVRNFYYGAFQREPTAAEAQAGRQRLNNAAALGRDQVIAEARLMGVQLIQSTNYNAGRTTEQYVTDLYQAFLQRAPDSGGLNHWVGHTNQFGRPATLEAFRVAIEFGELAGTLHRETFWLVPDHLGTPRMMADRTGSLAGIKRRDYLPFGEEALVNMAGRAPGHGFGGDDHVRQKFTSKERDAETGLDYFGARHYSATMGRFTGVDPALESMKLNNPQSFNRYTYSLNNPLRYIDPDGRFPIETAIDAVSLAHSFYEFVKTPSLATAGFLVWDAAATLIPYVPGSYVGKGIKLGRKSVEWVAKVGDEGYMGLKAAGIVTKLDDFESFVNNEFIRSGIGLLGQGDDSVRRVLGISKAEKAADFLGVTRSATFTIAETKGSDHVSAVSQLDNTAKALVRKVGNVKYTAEVILRHGQKLPGNFKIFGNHLYRWDDGVFIESTGKYGAWVLQKAGAKPITVRVVR